MKNHGCASEHQGVVYYKAFLTGCQHHHGVVHEAFPLKCHHGVVL